MHQVNIEKKQTLAAPQSAGKGLAPELSFSDGKDVWKRWHYPRLWWKMVQCFWSLTTNPVRGRNKVMGMVKLIDWCLYDSRTERHNFRQQEQSVSLWYNTVQCYLWPIHELRERNIWSSYRHNGKRVRFCSARHQNANSCAYVCHPR